MIFFIVVSSSFMADASSTKCGNVDEASIARHVNLPEFTIVSKREIFSACEVIIKAMGENVPFYVFDDFIIGGDLFYKREHITMKSIKEIQLNDFGKSKEILKEATAFKYTPDGSNGTYLYMFTDPECPYCDAAKNQMKVMADRMKFEIRVVFYPLPHHQTGKTQSINAICSNIDYNAYLLNKYGDTGCELGRRIVSNAIKAAEALGIEGTPAFVGPAGERVTGFDEDKIKEIL